MARYKTTIEAQSGSVSEVFRIALPLVLVASGNSIKLFCDRIMLANYNKLELAAAFTAGLTFFTLLVFFIAVVNYCSTFVSQYFGAKEYDKVGSSTWQGIIGATLSGLLMATGYWWAGPLFDLIGHGEQIRTAQTAYGSILFATGIFPLLMTALTSFWTGQGRTWTVLTIEVSTVILNIVLNFICIYGTESFPLATDPPTIIQTLWTPFHQFWTIVGLPHIPQMGIVGAAVGTAVSTFIGVAFAFVLFLSRSNRIKFSTWPKQFIDKDLLKRQLKYGVPNGIRTVLEVGAFNIFVLLLAHYGDLISSASTITFSINGLAFVPIFGFGNSVAIVVGQSIGAKKIDIAQNAVKSGMKVLGGYLLIVVIILVVFSELPLSLFNIKDPELYHTTRSFMIFISFTLIMNGISIMFSSAVSGAGDTKYPMKVTALLSWGAFVIPLLIIFFAGGSYSMLWAVFTLHVVPKACILAHRFYSGAWQKMQVIH